MKYSELKELTTQELQEKLVEEKGSLQKSKMAHSISPLENPLSIRESRRSIARISYELRKREIEA